MSSFQPRLTVICLCYNQKPYLKEALDSVFEHKTPETEVIFVDDASQDGSQEEFERISSVYNFDQIILHKENQGNCKSFNEALALSKGDYVIDFSCDDIIKGDLKNRIDFFDNSTSDTAVIFCNAELISENSKSLGYHFDIGLDNKSIQNIPTGNIFLEMLREYFVCVPTMMFRRISLLEFGGYDESLDYEDFDIKMKLGYKYCFEYQDEILVAKREHKLQKSRRFLSVTKGAKMSESTLMIFQRLIRQISSEDEIQALVQRCFYEGRNASFFNYPSKVGFEELLRGYGEWSMGTKLKWKLFTILGMVTKHFFSKI